MKTLIINSSNYVAGTDNTFTYNFPSTVKFPEKTQIGVSSIAVYNSTFSISVARGNNTITVVFPNGAGFLTQVFTIPDGYYSSSDLNYFLQYQCLILGWFATTNNGANNIYFLEIVQNSVQYKIQINAYYVPTSAQATTLGYTQGKNLAGANGFSYPTAYQTPTIAFNSIFGSLLGFSAGTYPATSQATNYSVLSSQSPTISPIDSYILTCNLIKSPYSIPADVFYSIPLTGSLGTLITQNPAQILFNDIASNYYSQLTIRFYDQLFNKIILNDKDVLITLAIKEPDE